VSYHGVVYTEALGPAAYIGRARVVPLRNTGAAISPFNAFLILQGIETLALRMDRICKNTLAVANSCKGTQGGWVNYAGLPDHADHALVQKYMGGRASGILSFGVKGGREAGRTLPGRAEAGHPPGQHRRRQVAGLPPGLDHAPPALAGGTEAKAGVSEDMVRLSIGIEHIDDIKADLEQALAAV
jgi:O-acetylhomoserine (thiol)-lyase